MSIFDEIYKLHVIKICKEERDESSITSVESHELIQYTSLLKTSKSLDVVFVIQCMNLSKLILFYFKVLV